MAADIGGTNVHRRVCLCYVYLPDVCLLCKMYIHPAAYKLKRPPELCVLSCLKKQLAMLHNCT